MQNNIFANIARQATTLSKIMDGRNKMEMREIISKYPQGITVYAFDMIKSGEQDSYPVFLFKEEPACFAFGGAVFKSIVESWIGQFDGSIEECSSALGASGGVKMIFHTSTTKNGRTITTVEIPD